MPPEGNGAASPATDAWGSPLTLPNSRAGPETEHPTSKASSRHFAAGSEGQDGALLQGTYRKANLAYAT